MSEPSPLPAMAALGTRRHWLRRQGVGRLGRRLALATPSTLHSAYESVTALLLMCWRPLPGAVSTRRNETMTRSEALRQLRGHKDYLASEYGVTELALFGSIARDGASNGSDIDILVRFDGPATSGRYFGVQFYLEDLLGRPADLVTDKALRPELRPYIEREAVRV